MSESSSTEPAGEPAGAEDRPGDAPVVGPPAKDPWKGLRGVMAGTLVLEAIVVLLVLPVIAMVGGGLTWVSGTYVIGLAVLMFLGAGVQGRSWALPYDLALQVLTLLGFVVDLALGAVGVLFTAVWLYILYLRSDMRDREARGLLPGQRTGGGTAH